jgi:hypothetical protein
MEATNGFKRSERKRSHGNLLRVWRSLIYVGGQKQLEG